MPVDERFQDYVSRPFPEVLSDLVKNKATGLLTAMGTEAQSRFRIKAHLPFPWLWDLVTDPRLVDVIEGMEGREVAFVSCESEPVDAAENI